MASKVNIGDSRYHSWMTVFQNLHLTRSLNVHTEHMKTFGQEILIDSIDEEVFFVLIGTQFLCIQMTFPPPFMIPNFMIKTKGLKETALFINISCYSICIKHFLKSSEFLLIINQHTLMGFNVFYPYMSSHISSTFVPDPWLSIHFPTPSDYYCTFRWHLKQSPLILRFLAFHQLEQIVLYSLGP